MRLCFGEGGGGGAQLLTNPNNIGEGSHFGLGHQDPQP